MLDAIFHLIFLLPFLVIGYALLVGIISYQSSLSSHRAKMAPRLRELQRKNDEFEQKLRKLEESQYYWCNTTRTGEQDPEIIDVEVIPEEVPHRSQSSHMAEHGKIRQKR